MVRLEPGDVAPDFELKNDEGEIVKLSELRGSPVVLYFYPRDDTPGCTKEACAFRDNFPQFGKLDARVFGISPDGEASHRAFKEKYQLPFPLLSDPDHQVAERYGAWGTKVLYGKEHVGILRSTFIVDAEGRIARVFRNVRVEGHAEKVLEALQ